MKEILKNWNNNNPHRIGYFLLRSIHSNTNKNHIIREENAFMYITIPNNNGHPVKFKHTETKKYYTIPYVKLYKNILPINKLKKYNIFLIL